MRYFVNIFTGALAKDYVKPAYAAYWKEISKREYVILYRANYKTDPEEKEEI